MNAAMNVPFNEPAFDTSVSPTIVIRELTLLGVAIFIAVLLVGAYVFFVDRPRSRSGIFV